jgi:hypothetical protein
VARHLLNAERLGCFWEWGAAVQDRKLEPLLLDIDWEAITLVETPRPGMAGIPAAPRSPNLDEVLALSGSEEFGGLEWVEDLEDPGPISAGPERPTLAACPRAKRQAPALERALVHDPNLVAPAPPLEPTYAPLAWTRPPSFMPPSGKVRIGERSAEARNAEARSADPREGLDAGHSLVAPKDGTGTDRKQAAG